MQENDRNNRKFLWIMLIGLVTLAIAVVTGAAVMLRTLPVNEPSLTTPTSIPTAIPTVVSPTVTPMPAVVSGERSAGDPYTPELGNTGYDVQHYTIQMALDPAMAYVEATATLEAISTVDNLGRISLDFIGFEIDALTVDGTAAIFRREEDKLLVDLSRPLPSGAPFSLVITYRGEPVQRLSPYLGFVEHLGLHYPGHDSLFVIAEPDGARFWFPANDHPRDKATFRFELTVPQGLTAVANGRLVGVRTEERPNGEQAETFIWEHNYPMATYLALAAAGPYERLERPGPDGVPLRDYVFPELRPDFERATAVTGEAMAWMGELFGPYPFEVYGHATVYVPNVSMETQTTVILSHRMMNEGTVIHELAHAWFGNWVSLDSWADMWRNEGFATYVTLMWETRHDPEELELRMAALETAVAERANPHPLNQLPPELLFSFDTYMGGAFLVHSLRQEVGDEAFFAGLRAYFSRYGGSVASHAEFQAVMEEAAGFSLDAFFAQWLALEP